VVEGAVTVKDEPTWKTFLQSKSQKFNPRNVLKA
jgi:hypothetical protein